MCRKALRRGRESLSLTASEEQKARVRETAPPERLCFSFSAAAEFLITPEGSEDSTRSRSSSSDASSGSKLLGSGPFLPCGHEVGVGLMASLPPSSSVPGEEGLWQAPPVQVSSGLAGSGNQACCQEGPCPHEQ